MKPIMAKAIGYMQPTIDPNMRLYVPFNEGVGAIAKDYSQYGNHAQFTDVEWSIGKGGNTGVFNGTSSYCDCGNDASLNFSAIDSDCHLAYDGVRSCRRPGGVGLYDATSNKTFAVWMGTNYNPYIRSYDHTANEWSTAVRVGTSVDDPHNYPMLLMDNAGYLHVFYGAHASIQRHSVSNSPRAIGSSISNWTNGTISEMPTVTYPFPVKTDNGDIYLFNRDDFRGGIDRPIGFIKSIDNGNNWSGVTHIIDITDREDNLKEIYLGEVRQESAHDGIPEKFHLVWTIAGGSYHNEFHRNVYYAYFKPGDGHLYDVDDNDLGVTINNTESENNCKIYDSGPPSGTDIEHINRVDVFSNGKPVVIYTKRVDEEVYCAAWNGEMWDTNYIVNAAYTGAMEVVDDEIHYILFTDGGIKYYKSSDLGKNWDFIRIIYSPAERSPVLDFIANAKKDKKLWFKTQYTSPAFDQTVYISDTNHTFRKQELTIGAWVKLSPGYSTYGYVVSRRDVDDVHYQLAVNADKQIVLRGSSHTKSVVGNTVLNEEQWYYILGTITVTSGEVFLNGVSDGTDTVGELVSKNIRTIIGARWDTYPATADHFNGTIGKVRIYNRALSAAQIVADCYELPQFT